MITLFLFTFYTTFQLFWNQVAFNNEDLFVVNCAFEICDGLYLFTPQEFRYAWKTTSQNVSYKNSDAHML